MIKLQKGQTVQCLDKGFVTYIDSMGDDQAIVQAARVSVSGGGVRSVSDDDALIRYLMRHKHTTPFEMVVFKFHIKMPIFVLRQLVRHRMSSMNEESARYGEMRDEFYLPALEDMETQAGKNKQGRSGLLVDGGEEIIEQWNERCQESFAFYQYLLNNKAMARELARIHLPVNTYSSFYWKIDLHNLFHFLKLRLDPHAQKEIRVYAEAMARFVRTLCPLAYQAFSDYILNSMTLTVYDIERLKMILRTAIDARTYKFPPMPTKREEEEWSNKLVTLMEIK